MPSSFDKRTYMRAYMRRRRGSLAALDSNSPRPPRDWLDKLRGLHKNLLRAQAAVSRFRDDSLRLDLPPDPPEHLTAAVTQADAALAAHEALDPARAREYFTRYDADQLRRAADRLQLALDRLPARTRRGRPVNTAQALAAAQEEHRAATERRQHAYTAFAAALAQNEAGTPLPARDLTAIQNRWERAKQREEAAHARLTELQRRAAEDAAAVRHAQAERADTLAQIADLRAQAAALLAPLPDPPTAPLYPSLTPAQHQQRRERRQARSQPREPTAADLARLAERYQPATLPSGARALVRAATGRPVRAATLRAPGGGCVRVLDVLDALAPCGLV